MVDLDVASIGFGVQSTAIALMSGMGLIPKADKYYFSELRETPDTVKYIEYITPILSDMGIIVETLRPMDIYEHIMSWNVAERVSMIPVWFLGVDGRRQPLNRQCTSDFKIEVIAGKIRQDLNRQRLKPHSVRVWQGISLDEKRRAEKKPLFTGGYRINHYPFIGHYANVTYPSFTWESYSREKIIERIFKYFNIPVPPKSSCFFCPFHEIEYWFYIYQYFPVEWELACILDDSIRNYNTPVNSLRCGPFYLYAGLVPLRDIDFEKEIKNKEKLQIEISGCNSGFCFV